MKPVIIYWYIFGIHLFTVFGREFTKSNMRNLNSDLEVYFKTLNQVADFFLIHENYVNLVVDFGIFLQNINLRSVFKDKGSDLPDSIKIELKRLIHKNAKLRRVYKSKKKLEPKQFITLQSSFSNEHLWVRNMAKFHDINKQKEPFLNYNMKYLRSRYSNWDKYMNTSDVHTAIPSPRQSDMCLYTMGQNPINYSGLSKQCDIPEFCREHMFMGLGSGYALTHRLLLLLFARHGKRCHVISEKEDTKLRKKFCASIYSESSYIAMNHFKAFDLFMEQIVLCALDGHSEFIQRQWLTKALSAQTRDGCFPDSVDGSVSGDGRHLILDGLCDGHTTVLVASVVASAVRFILEKFY